MTHSNQYVSKLVGIKSCHADNDSIEQYVQLIVMQISQTISQAKSLDIGQK